jgi:predicted dehydrogenase
MARGAPEAEQPGERGRALTDERELRVALVGCGAVAREVHLPLLDDLQGVEVVGVCDLDRERARELAEQFGVPGFPDLVAMLKAAEPDVVHVLTRPDTHAELAGVALEAGCHVLVEKPFAYSSREAERVVELARQKRRRVSVVHNYLDHPAVTELLERVGQGDVGEVCSVHFLHGRRDQRYVPDPWYFQTRGGRLGETLPHALYLVAALIPKLRVRYVAAQHMGRIQLPEHTSPLDAGNDELRVELSGEGGSYATILYSFNSTLPQSLIVVGTDATLQASIGPEPMVHRWSSQGPDTGELISMANRWLTTRLERRLRRRASPRAQRDTAHVRQIRAFLNSLRNGEEPPVSEEDALEVVRLWEEIVGRYAGAEA